MGKIKRITSFVLAMLMMLLLATACTPNGGVGEDIVGRYVEHKVTPEGVESFNAFKKLSDGTIVCYADGFETKFTSKDNGKTWEKSDGPGKNDTRFKEIYNAAISPGGYVYAIYPEFPDGYEEARENQDYDFLQNAKVKYHILKVSPDGKVEDVSIAYADEKEAAGKDIGISQLYVLTDDIIYINMYVDMYYEEPSYESDDASDDAEEYDGEADSEADGAESDAEEAPEEDYFDGGASDYVAVINTKTGEELYTIEDEMLKYPNYLATSDENYYVADYEGNIHAFNILTGKKVELTNLSFKDEKSEGSDDGFSRYNLSALQVNNKGDIYIIDNMGVKRSKADGSEVETIMTSVAYAFGSGSFYPQFFEVLDNDTFLMLGYGNEKAEIYYYEYDATAIWSAAESISVWSLYDIGSVRLGIAAYRAKYQNALVEYEIGLQNVSYDASSQDIDTALQSLNTRMLASEGPDVVILDGVNIKNYVNNGLLLNLSKDIDTSSMFKQIMEPLKEGGKTYYIPTRFELPVLMGDKKDIANLTSFDEIIGEIKSRPGLPKYDPDDYEAYWRPLSDEEKPAFNFTNVEEIFELLWMGAGGEIIKDGKIDTEMLKTLLEKTKEIAERYELNTEEAGQYGGGAMAMSYGGGEVFRFSGSMMNYFNQRAKYAGTVLDRIDVIAQMVYSEIKSSVDAVAFPGVVTGTWTPKVNVAVNAATNNKKSSLEFVQGMLSVDVQGALYMAGMPVTKEGADAQIEKINKDLEEYSKFVNKTVTFEFDYEALVNSMGEPMINDSFVQSTIFYSANEYCFNRSDLEGAINEIEQKLKTYLGEQQ